MCDDQDSNADAVHHKLRLNSYKWPAISNRLLVNVTDKIKHFVNNLDITMTHKHKNLSFLERKGLSWCLRMKNTNKIHFSQADKGGATVLMDPVVVNQVILSELEDVSKYLKLVQDPRIEVKRKLLSICDTNLGTKGISKSEHFHITGKTDNGKSHHPLFKAGKPNVFPLLKLHSACLC